MKFISAALVGLAVALSGLVANAHPVALASPCPLGSAELHERHSKRQEGAPALTDLDILQFALTLEHLEAAFYQQGFEKFPVSDFEALGFSPETISGLVKIGETEATHVTQLMAAISGAGAAPVQACTYEFGFTDAATMVQTAKVLEAVGVSAYLGAAPLVTDPAILAAAGSIVTVEARHQTFIRTTVGDAPIPQAFDVAIGARQIFTLAASFIVECPPGSSLGLTAFPSLVIQNADTVVAGSILTLSETSLIADGTPAFCAFTSGETATQFSPLENGNCSVPSGLTGEVFVVLTSAGSGAVLADEQIIAGPSILVFS